VNQAVFGGRSSSQGFSSRTVRTSETAALRHSGTDSGKRLRTRSGTSRSISKEVLPKNTTKLIVHLRLTFLKLRFSTEVDSTRKGLFRPVTNPRLLPRAVSSSIAKSVGGALREIGRILLLKNGFFNKSNQPFDEGNHPCSSSCEEGNDTVDKLARGSQPDEDNPVRISISGLLQEFETEKGG
jgi:hypothetical protein